MGIGRSRDVDCHDWKMIGHAANLNSFVIYK